MAFAKSRATPAAPMNDHRHHTAEDGGLRAHFAPLAPTLTRFLTARLGNAADAEDVVQDLWLKLAALPSGPIANPRAYLHKMALNMANDLVRSRMRQRGREAAWSDIMVAETDMVAIDPAPSPERAMGDKLQLEAIMRAIRAMPDRAQHVFRRHRIDGLSHSQVAAEMEISKSAVEKNMATAMKHLMRALDSESGI